MSGSFFSIVAHLFGVLSEVVELGPTSAPKEQAIVTGL